MTVSHIKISSVFIFTLLFLNYSSSCIGQENPHKANANTYNQALNAYHAGDTQTARSLFMDLFENTEYGNLGHIYNTIPKACAMNDTLLIKVLAKSGTRKGAKLHHLQRNSSDPRCGGSQKFAKHITPELVRADSIYYCEGLDSFLISELVWLEERDQLFRDDYPFEVSDAYAKFSDSINFLFLEKIVEMEGGKLPSYRKLGREGARALETLLIHLDIEMIVELFPAIVKSIHLGEFFDAETVLYQIDRNMVGGSSLFRYDKETGTIVPFKDNTWLHPKLGFHQYYGFMDISDMKTRTIMYWPFHPEVDKTIQQEMYDVLWITPPMENARKAHIQKKTREEFINALLNLD